MSKRTMNVQMAHFSGYTHVQIGVIRVDVVVADIGGGRPRLR